MSGLIQDAELQIDGTAEETESQTATAAADAAAAAAVAAGTAATTEPLSPGAVGAADMPVEAADLAEGAYSQSSGVGRAESAHPVCEAYLSELMQAARPFLPCNMDPQRFRG